MNQQDEDKSTGSILVVDDTPADLVLLSGLLKDQGFQVRSIPNGELALQAAAKDPPDLILLDIQMPDLDGYAACERFKAQDKLKHIPVLFISIMDETLDKVRGFKVGCADYITKPFEFEEVLARVNTHLANQRMRVQLQGAHDRLEEANALLEKRVQQRTNELELANAELKKHREDLEALVESRTSDLFKFARAVESSPVSILITDASGRIEYANKKFCQVNGYTQEEVLGQNPRILKSEVHPPSYHEELWRTILSGKEWIGNFCNRKKNGELYWERASISSILDSNGEITHFVAIKEDITEQKHAEEKLIEAKEAAEAATRAKSLFLANMSHEIRTPMNALIGLTHLALKSDFTPQQRNYLEKIKTSANSLLGIINDILDFSKIEADKVELETITFRISEITQQMLDTFGLEASGRSLVLTCDLAPDIPDLLVGDPMRLRQVLTNLVSNALKFTKAGEVSVKIDLVSQDPDQAVLRFSVRDTGIGLSPEQVAGIFEVFSQADGTTTRRFGGTGLGLSICQRLVNLMGGEIHVESKIGTGSVFTFEGCFGLPDEQAQAMYPVEVDIAIPNLKGTHILLAEDNEINQEVALGLLEDTEATVTVVGNGKEAVQMVGDLRFDLILMDVHMPVMDGREATRRIRDQESVSGEIHLPIVALSASVLDEDKQKAIEAGMDDHLSKPINPDEFYALLARLIAPTR